MGVNDSNASSEGIRLRPATAEDYDDVVSFTRDTWSDRDGSDYIPDIYHDWIEGPDGGDRQRTFVAEVDATVVGIAQAVRLSDHEIWCQGIRIAPDHRGEGIADAITWELFDWGREGGAVVARNMVFSWNVAGLGHSRAAGFSPATEFRWALPEPDGNADPEATATGDSDVSVTASPDAAWSYWADSDAREHLRGLVLSPEETWATQELTREVLQRAAEENAVFAVQNDGTRAMAFRVRDYERENEQGETERWAEYGVGAWDDVPAARALFAAIRRDAGELGVDRTRVLIPETARYVSDVAATRTAVSDDPDFVMAADLTADYGGGD
ncbi:GNAT family N-acetyltransferase [Halostella sp. PRR32]|uniref:GNAT family N-acetyltransferase n=1 Tax=Halostella sp. PRR32 TaxID=3098147 RepID=UPI002B1CE726|nr:GNAT family N-acetyltransferase [Halostella sp. PRR32]